MKRNFVDARGFKPGRGNATTRPILIAISQRHITVISSDAKQSSVASPWIASSAEPVIGPTHERVHARLRRISPASERSAMIRVTDTISLDEAELDENFVRASGPGG